jgi:hypothetical protein
MKRRNFLVLSEAAFLKFSGFNIPCLATFSDTSCDYTFTDIEDDDPCVDLDFSMCLTNQLLIPCICDDPACGHRNSTIHLQAVNDVLEDYFEAFPADHLYETACQWKKVIKHQMASLPSDEITEKLKDCRFPYLTAMPFQYKNLRIIPILNAWDLYQEERHLNNDLTRNILCYLEHECLYSIRDEQNISLSCFDVRVDDINKVYISDHTGKRYTEPDKNCIKAAQQFIAHLNILHSESRIDFKSRLSDDNKMILDDMRKKMQKDEAPEGVEQFLERCLFLETCFGLNDIPEEVFKGTHEFEIDALLEVMGMETIDSLLSQIDRNLKI